MGTSSRKTYAINFDTRSLDNLITRLRTAADEAGNLGLSPEAIQSITDLTNRVTYLENAMKKLSKGLDATVFSTYAQAVDKQITAINRSFEKTLGLMEKLGAGEDISNLQKNIKNIYSDLKDENKAYKESSKQIKKDVRNDLKAKEKLTQPQVKEDKTSKSILTSAEKTVEIHKEDTKEIEKANEALKEQEKLQDSLNKKKSKEKHQTQPEGEKKKTEIPNLTEEIPEQKVTITYELPENLASDLKKDIQGICDEVSKSQPHVNVEVAFVSQYRTRKQNEELNAMIKTLNELMGKVPEEVAAQFPDTIAGIRKQLDDQLKSNKPEFMFDTNVPELSNSIIETMKQLSAELGKIELHANVVLNEQQIQEQLKNMKDLSLQVSSLEVSPSFIDGLANAEKLLKKRDEINKKAEKEEEAEIVEVPKEEQDKLNDFIDKALGLKRMLKQISSELKTIPLQAEFDKAQIQEALDLIDGLSVKIDTLNLEGLNKTLGGVAGIPLYVGGGTGTGTGVNVSAGDVRLGSEINEQREIENETLKSANNEMDEFVKTVDKVASALTFTDKGTIKQTKDNLNALNTLIRGFRNPQPGHTLLDWAFNTQMLGNGQTRLDNIKILQEGIYDWGKKTRQGGQLAYARMNKIRTPQEISNDLLAVDKDGNYIYINKSGGTKQKQKDKNGNVLKDANGQDIYKTTPYFKNAANQLVEELFKSMVMYGVNRNTMNGFSNMLSEQFLKAYGDDEDKNRTLLSAIETSFREKYPYYGTLLTGAKIPTTQKPKTPQKAVLDESLVGLTTTEDKFENLNSEIIEYCKLWDLPLDRLDKTLLEALKEVKTVDEYLKMGKEYSQQKQTLDLRSEKASNIFNTLAKMSPKDYDTLMSKIGEGQYSSVGAFVHGLQKGYPEEWERLQTRRQTVIKDETKRRLNRIQKSQGAFTTGIENDQNVDYFLEYITETFPEAVTNTNDFFKQLGKDYNINSQDIKFLKTRFNDRQLDAEASKQLTVLQQTKSLLHATDEDVKEFGEANNLSKKTIERMQTKLKTLRDIAVEAVNENEKAEKEEEKKTPKTVRKKTEKEMRQAHKETEKKEVKTEQRAEELKPLAERISKNEAYYSQIQEAANKANMSINANEFVEESEKDQERLRALKQKLEEIEALKQAIQQFKNIEGVSLSDEDVLKQTFQFSETSYKATLTTLRNYENLLKEKAKLEDNIAQQNKTTKTTAKEVPVVELSKEFKESVEKTLKGFAVDESGNIKDTKENQKKITQLKNKITKEYQNEPFNLKSLESAIPDLGNSVVDNVEELRKLKMSVGQQALSVAHQLKSIDKEKEPEKYKQVYDEVQKLYAQEEEITRQMRNPQMMASQKTENFFNSMVDMYSKSTGIAKEVLLGQSTTLGEDTAEGYVEGVESKTPDIQQATAKAMEEGIESAKDALDSHSPSKEYYRLGMWAVEGYLEGVKTILPLLKEVSSQIKINSDGSVTDPKSIEKANEFITRLKEYGVTKVGRFSPFADLTDSQGNVVSKGLKSLYGELPRTAVTKQIQKGDISQFKDFFDAFTDAYGMKFNKNGQLSVATFKTKMKQMGVGDKDLSILIERFSAYANDRVKRVENQRAQLKSIVDGLGKNADGKTISKYKNVNGDAFQQLFRGYISTYKNAYTKEGIVDETFKSFAKDMGLSDENAQRIKDVFAKISEQMWDDIEKTRLQCLNAVNNVSDATKDAITENNTLEEKAIENNKDDTLASIEEERKAKEIAIKEEEKQRKALIAKIEAITGNSNKYYDEFRAQGNSIVANLKNKGSLDEGLAYVESSKNLYNQRGSDRFYYDIMKRANRLMTSDINNVQVKNGAMEISNALRQMTEETDRSSGALNELNIRLMKLEAESEKAGKTFLSQIVQRLQKANADFFARYFSIRDIIRYFRTFTQTVTEYDTALTEMRKVSDESVESLKEYQKATFDVAETLGTTALQIQQSTADWLRLGESMEEASESARVATMLFNVSEFDNVNEATEALVAMSQAYKDMDKTEIIDVLNNIGNNYSIATDQLATALQASSAALMTQGNDLYEAAALVTAGNAIIQDASKTGTGIRTIALRIAGQKMDKEELEKELNELGEEVDEWVMQTEAKKRKVILEYTKVASNNRQGVDILDENGNLKDTYHILLEISKVYKEIQEEDKRYGTNRAQGLVEELAGKVRSNIAASILNNPEMLESVYESAMNSAGSAAEENAKYLDSIAGKTAQLKNEWQEFQNLILDSEMLKDLLDLGKLGLDLINALISKIPNLTTVVLALGSAILASSKDVFFANQSMSKLQLVWSGISSYLKQYTRAQNEATIATEAGTVAIEAQTQANIAAAVASKAKNALIAVAITAVVTLLVKAVKHAVTYRKELERAANESRDKIKEIKSQLQESVQTIDSVSKKYAEMAQKVGNLGQINQNQGALSNEEYQEFLDISNQLADVFPSLTQGYDDNGNAILSLNGSVMTITQSLQDLLQVQRDIAAEDMLKNADKIFKDDDKKYDKIAKNRKKKTDDFLRQEAVYNAILNNQTEGIDYNEVSTIFDEIFGSASYLEGSVLDKYSKDYQIDQTTGLDFSELTDKERKAIEQHFAQLRYEYQKEQAGFRNDVESINADFRTYMNLYAQTIVDDDFDKQIVSGIINSLTYEDLDEAKQGDFDAMTRWLQDDIINALDALDDDAIKKKMDTILNDTTLSLKDKNVLINSLLGDFQEEFGEGTEDNPLVIWFKLQQANDNENLQASIDHIVAGMTPQRVETELSMRARAESYLNQLTPNQIQALNEHHITAGSINSLQDVYNLLNQIENVSGRIQGFGELLSSSGMAGATTSWKQVRDELVGMAKEGKLDDTTLKEYAFFDKIIKELGLSAEEADDALSGMVDTINSMAQQNAVDVLNAYKSGIDSLDDAYQKFKNEEFIDASTLSSIQDAFGSLDSYKEFEKAVMRGEKNLQQYFDDIVTEYAIQESALSELTEENKDWVKQQLIASGITKESAEKSVESALKHKQMIENEIRATLELMNAEVQEKKGRDDLVVSTENLDRLTAEEIVHLMQEANISGQAAQSVAAFALKKELAKDASLRNDDDINYLVQLAQMAGLAGTQISKMKYVLENQETYQKNLAEQQRQEEAFYKTYGKDSTKYVGGAYQAWARLQEAQQKTQDSLDSMDKFTDEFIKEIQDKFGFEVDLDLDYSGAVDSASSAGSAAGEAFKDALDKILAMYDAELDAGVISFQTYVDKSRAIIEQYYKDGRITAQEYYDELADFYNKQVSQYDKVISAVQKRLQDETQALEKEKDNIEKSYNDQIEIIQKKIDALQDENDEIDRNMELSKAQYELARAQNQRTRLMYSESRGFYYEADLKGVSEAEDNVRRAKMSKQIAEYEKQIKSLQDAMNSETKSIDDQIQKLNEYADAWGKVSSQLEDAQNALRATEVLGPNWENNILNGLDLLNTFTNAYIDAQQKQKDAYLEARRAEANNPVGGGSGGSTTTSNSGSGGTTTTNTGGKQDDGGGQVNYTPQGVWKYNGKIYASQAQAEAVRNQERQAVGDAAYNNYLSSHGYKSSMPYAAQKPLLEGAEKARQNAYITFDSNKKVVRANYSGTDSAKAGEALVGELGSEIVLHNNGTASIVDKPTLMDMQGGEKVFNAEETERILKSKYKPLSSVNPSKFKMLHSFAGGTSSPMQRMIAAQAVGIANGINTGMVSTSTIGGQTINQTFNVTLPNINDASKATDLIREFQQMSMKATQYFKRRD